MYDLIIFALVVLSPFAFVGLVMWVSWQHHAWLHRRWQKRQEEDMRRWYSDHL